MDPQNPEPSSTLGELASVRSQLRAQASGKPLEEAPVKEPEAPNEEEPKAAASEGEASEASAPTQEPEEETLIRIGDQTFKTQGEAIRYAEKLEQEKAIAEAHAMGVQEALRVAQPQVQAAPQEDDFETRFYTDPKGTLKAIKEEAKTEALAAVNQKQAADEQWNTFFDENPDLAGQRHVAEMVLRQNWDTIGKVTDLAKGRKLLAQKTRAIFQDYEERKKPTKELPRAPAQTVSAGSMSGVTPQKVTKEEKPLDFAAQLRTMRKK